jgi:hypothetical protein
MRVEELGSFAICDRSLTPERIAEIARAVEAGAILQMVESSFADPGPDYCRVTLDGQPIAYAPGY